MKVTLIDSMGSDLFVVNAARVSFHKESKYIIANNNNTYENIDWVLSDSDVKLITYLAKHNHWSPFAHCFLSFRVKAPIFVARQLVKHQVGLTWNEVSRRYVDEEPEYWFPNKWRGRPTNGMKQGSSDVEFKDHELATVDQLIEDLNTTYLLLCSKGLAPEQARMILPQNMMTEWIWSGSLMAFARICKLRLDPHAQAETREIAEFFDKECSQIFPVSWKALMEN